MESQIWCLPASSVWGGLSKGTVASASNFFWEKAVLQLLPWFQILQALPGLPLVPFKLLPLCWTSEGMSLSKSVHGFFKRHCFGVQQFLSHLGSFPTGFYSQKLWALILLELELWAGGVPIVGLGPVAPRYPSPFLSTTGGCGTSLLHVSSLPTSLDVVSPLIL